MAMTTYSGQVKLQVCQRLVHDWATLADYFDIPLSDRAGFEKGREPQRVWEWLEQRGRLAELGSALEAIGREDLLPLLTPIYQSDRPPAYLAPFHAQPLPQHFVPRPEVTELLKARLLNEEPKTPGILMITAIHGLGGIGKSTLAAALVHDYDDPDKKVQKRFRDGILWATLGQQPDILPILSGWIQAMRDYDFRPTTIEAASVHLRTLLQDKAVLLVVDDVWQPEDAKHFQIGGPHCYVLITTREAIIAKIVNADLYDLNVMTPEQALTLLSGQVGYEFQELEQKEALALAEEVGYLPLALELAAAQIVDGISWTELLTDLQAEIARLETLDLPEAKDISDEATLKRLSLRASLFLSLRRLSENERQRFAWLGILPEDLLLSPEMVTTLWNTTSRQACDTLRYLRNKALLLPGVPRTDGTPTYRLHDLVHDLARGLIQTPATSAKTGDLPGLELTLQIAHTKLLERYKQCIQGNFWYTLPDDRYIHNHLTWHFQKAGLEKQIHLLLREETTEGCNGWYQIREQLGQTAGFLADVNLAWKLAEKESDIGLQCRYLFIITSINSLAKNIPPGFLTALVKTGIWNIEQGVAYAQQLTEPEQRFRVLTGLVSLMTESKQEEIVQKTVETAKEIKNRDEKISALIELVHSFSKPLTEETIKEIQNIDDERIRVELLEKLFAHLSESQAINALSYIQTIGNELKRTEALVILTQHLPEAKKEKALSIALNIKDDWFRAEVLAEIAHYNLPESLLKEAFRAAQTINDSENQARAIVGIGPFLPDPPWEELLTLSKVIKNPKRRNRSLGGLIPKMPPIFLQKMLATIHAVESEQKRANELRELLPHLWTEPLVKEAFAIIQSIKNDEIRSNVLMRITRQMVILGFLQEIFAEIQHFKAKEDQFKVLTELIPVLSIYGHFQQALNIVNMIESTGKRDDILIDLVSILKLSEHYDESFLATQAIKSEWRKAAMLSGIAHYLPEKSLRMAFEVVEAFEDNNNQTQALMGLIPRLAELGYSHEAIDKIKNIRDRGKQSEILSRLAIYLPKQLLKEALLLIQIEDNDERTIALVELSPYLPEPFLKEVLTELQVIRDETTLECSSANTLIMEHEQISQLTVLGMSKHVQ